MPKVLHIATGPNGEKFKRGSTTRRYSHVVIGRPSIEVARAHVERDVAYDRKRHDDAVKHAANGYEPSPWMIGKPDFKDPTTTVAERFREEGRESATEWLKDKPETADEYATAERARKLASIEEQLKAGHFSTFVALGWSGRYDLAVARFGEFSTYTDLRAVAVEA